MTYFPPFKKVSLYKTVPITATDSTVELKRSQAMQNKFKTYYVLQFKHDPDCEPLQVSLNGFAAYGLNYEQIELVPKSALELANAKIKKMLSGESYRILNHAIGELKIENKKLADENETLKNQVAVLSYKSPSNLMIENAKLRAALEEIELENHVHSETYQIAREALEKLK